MEDRLVVVVAPRHGIAAAGGPGGAYLASAWVAQVPHEDAGVDVPGVRRVGRAGARGEEGGVGEQRRRREVRVDDESVGVEGEEDAVLPAREGQLEKEGLVEGGVRFLGAVKYAGGGEEVVSIAKGVGLISWPRRVEKRVVGRRPGGLSD